MIHLPKSAYGEAEPTLPYHCISPPEYGRGCRHDDDRTESCNSHSRFNMTDHRPVPTPLPNGPVTPLREPQSCGHRRPRTPDRLLPRISPVADGYGCARFHVRPFRISGYTEFDPQSHPWFIAGITGERSRCRVRKQYTHRFYLAFICVDCSGDGSSRCS